MDAFALHGTNSLSIGNTPLVALNGYEKRLFAKLEWHNPFGSLKDRAAYWMIREAERTGQLKSGYSVVIEPTSGNTGIALSNIAKTMGYEVEIVIPDRVSEETKEIIRLTGAKVSETSDDLCPRVGPGTDQSIALASAIVKSRPEKYFMPNQYENEANYLAHYETTGPEIWRQMNGEITHLVAGIGTGGTITGTGEYLKEMNPKIKVIGVTPKDEQHNLQGLRNFKVSAKPEVLKRREKVVDEFIEVSDEDAFQTVRRLALEYNLFVGPSSGAVAYVGFEIGDDRSKVVMIFADDGRKYRSVYLKRELFKPMELDKLINV